MSIEKILKEPFVIHKIIPKNALKKRILELLDMVGLDKGSLNRYPHEFSGGQRQRIVIARALALEPEFIVADEPVSALDISIQAQVLNLLKQLLKDLGLTYLFISHDLSVIRYISDRIAVMYLGEIVEISPSEELFWNSKHPYTQALLSSVSKISTENNRSDRILLKGDLPSPVNPPSGCKFHTRCIHAIDKCREIPPETIKISENHYANCHLLKE
jgi:oligopeptide/dipeptide ABC transporter ATP-binding protein